MGKFRRLLLWFLAATAATPAFANASDVPKPVAVYIEADPWLMVVGSDVPTFALYDSCLVIYRNSDGYKSIQLKPDECRDLTIGLQIDAVAQNSGHYDVDEGITDQPTHLVLVYKDGKRSISTVYGRLRVGVRTPDIPEVLIQAIRRMDSFRHPDAQPWLPAKIEVMIWPYEHARDESIAWPTGWPDLNSPDTILRHEDTYSLYLPSEQLAALDSLLKTQLPRGAVEINDRKWSVAYRFPFPGISVR
jgi:hypothetical protein